MEQNAQFAGPRRSLWNGFSTIELVVSMAVILIASAIAIPVITTTLRFYRMNDAASRVAGVFKFTRFEAIRRNTPIAGFFRQTGTTATIWTDSIANAQPDPTEMQTVLSGDIGLLADGVAPPAGPINTAVKTTVTAAGVNGSIVFDQRGAVVTGGGGAVYAVYIGNAGDPNYGYRAIIVMPSGAIQVWSSSAAGDWRPIS